MIAERLTAQLLAGQPAADPGRAVATWGIPHEEVVLNPFAPLADDDAAALAADAEDVVRYLSADA